MNHMPNKKLSSEFNGRIVEVNTKKFGIASNAASAARAKHDKKYNLRIKDEDLVLLDALARTANVSRSEILNTLLHDLLLDALRSETQLDVQLLLAQAADDMAYYNPAAHPWVHDVMEGPCNQLVSNMTAYNSMEFHMPPLDEHELEESHRHSEAYHAVKNALKGVKK